MHPDVDEGAAVGAFALRDLVLVVRELQVHAAAVDVEVLAQQRAAIAEHSMCQPRAAGAEGCPTWRRVRLLILAFHRHEVQRVVLARSSTATRSPARSSSSDLPDSLP